MDNLLVFILFVIYAFHLIRILQKNCLFGFSFILITFIFLSGVTVIGIEKLSFSLGDLSIYILDILCVLLLIPILLRRKYIYKKIISDKLFIYISLYFILSYILIFWHIPIHGFSKEIAAARRIIPNSIIFFYLFTFDYNSKILKKLFKLIIYLSVLVIFISIPKIIVEISDLSLDTSDISYRSLYGYTPQFFFFILLPAFVFYLSHKKRSKALKIIMIVSLGIIIMARHRSVWVLASASIFTVLYFYRQYFSKLLNLCLIFLAILIFLFLMKPKFLSIAKLKLSRSFISNKAEFERSTGQYRIDRWKAQFEQNFDPLEAIFGKGYGWDRTAKVRNRYIYTSMHNHYIEILFNGGYFSVLFFLIYTYLLIKNLFHLLKNMPTNKEFYYIFIAIFLGYLPYGMINGYPIYYYIVLGIGVSFIHSESKKIYSHKKINTS